MLRWSKCRIKKEGGRSGALRRYSPEFDPVDALLAPQRELIAVADPTDFGMRAVERARFGEDDSEIGKAHAARLFKCRSGDLRRLQ
jgi:hypothetical protein